MKILYGTTNRAKLESMKRVTCLFPIELIGLNEIGLPMPVIEETGSDPLENAKIKARAYYEAFGMPVFSCDSGLYIDELENHAQPGTHIRRVGGIELNDDEMIEYYSALAARYGGRLTARYRNAICFIAGENTEFCSMDRTLATEPFLLVSQPHEKRSEGFPLDSISIDIASGKYYYDLVGRSVDQSAVEQGFAAFFADALSRLES